MPPRSYLVPVMLLVLIAGPTSAELVCPQPVHDAGVQRTGAALRHRFVLVNQGETTIRIHVVKPSCGCLKPILERQILQPREQTSIAVEVNTVTQAAGKNGWQLLVRYREDREEREVALLVQAELQRDLAIEPAALVVNTSTPSTHVFTLTERRARPVEIVGSSSSCAHTKAQSDRPVREGEVWRRTITLDVQGSCPEGRHEGVLCLHTDDSSSPELKVPFTIVKRSQEAVTRTPNAIELLVSGNAPLPARVVQLSSHNGTAVLVDHVEPDHACLRCTFAAGPGVRSTVRVLVDRDKLPPGRFEGQVRVHLRQPVGEVVTIPVQVGR